MIMTERRKWLVLVFLLGICMTGCGRKETGSDLLTDTKEAIVPVKEVVVPAVEETPECIALHVYCGDEQAENIVQKTVYVEEVTEQSIMEELGSALNLDPQAGLKDISFGTYGGDKVVMLDLHLLIYIMT